MLYTGTKVKKTKLQNTIMYVKTPKLLYIMVKVRLAIL